MKQELMSIAMAISTALVLALIVSFCIAVYFLRPDFSLDEPHKGELTTIVIDGIEMPVAESIRLDELKTQLQKMVDGKTEFDFLGITATDVDCIYFMPEDKSFNIDYEAMAEAQLPFIEKLREYANSKNIKSKLMTYGNAPHYSSENPAPVLRIKTNASIDRVAEIARDILLNVFNNPPDAKYLVVP